MRLGTLPLSTGLGVAGLPRLLGFRPGPERLGWIAADRDRDVVAIGAVRVEHAHRAKWALYVAHDLASAGAPAVDSLLVVGPRGSGRQAAAFARVIGTPERGTRIAEVDGALFRASGDRAWREIPRPSDGAYIASASEPAASWEELCRRYDVTPGPQSLANAPMLDRQITAAIALMAPMNRFRAANAAIDKIARTRTGLARDVDELPNRVALLAHLLTDRVVANAILHAIVRHPEKVQALVTAHRIAHPESGQDLRGTAAMAVYATSPTPQLALRIVEQAPEAVLSRTVERLWRERVPGRVPYLRLASRDTLKPLLVAQGEHGVALQDAPGPPGLLAGAQVGMDGPGLG